MSCFEKLDIRVRPFDILHEVKTFQIKFRMTRTTI